MQLYYLKENIKATPLIYKWYAWTHLVAPQTAGCNLEERYLKVLKSYLTAPHIHLKAARDPKLIGGPFVNLDEKYISEVKQLFENIEFDASKLLELNRDLKKLDIMLQEEAKGQALDNLYSQLPNNLKGMVELHYDPNNNPGFSLFEKLIYDKFYDPRPQSVALSIIKEDFQPFALSTPHLTSDQEIHIQIAFSDKNLDLLFASRYTGCDPIDLAEKLKIPEEKWDLFQSYFTTSIPELPTSRAYLDEGIRIRYFGHACVLIQTKRVSILFDPVISYKYVSDIPRFTMEDIPDEIDYVIFTHNHQDHVLFETILQIRHKIKNLVLPNNKSVNLLDPSMKHIFKNIGFFDIICLDDFDEIQLENGKIIALPFLGEHGDLNISSKHAYCIELSDKKIFLGADSNNLDPNLYDNIRNVIGQLDILFLGMECDGAPASWIYGPLFSTPLKRDIDYQRSLSGSNFQKAWKIVESLSPAQVYIYAMGQEPWLNHVMALNYTAESLQIIESDKLLRECKKSDIISERLFGKKEIFL